MTRAFIGAAAFIAACSIASFDASQAQVPPAPLSTSPPPSPTASGSPSAPFPTPVYIPGATPSPPPTASPTPPPLVVQPAAVQIAVGTAQRVSVGSVFGQMTVTAADPALVELGVDQSARTVTILAKNPGTTTLTITDQRGVSATVAVRTAYYAGTVDSFTSVRITGDPAGADFVKRSALAAALQTVQTRPGAQVVATADQISYNASLAQDNIASVNVPVFIQGDQYFPVDTVTHVRVENVAAPKIVPDSLMVSDFPERLTENGQLFTADLKRTQPSRFLYFHYNPPGEPDRRIVLRAQNLSPEPAIVQFISGQGGPSTNEMLTGHVATYTFLRNLVQNQGQILVVPGNGTMNLVAQPLPAKSIVCNLLQLRVLNGSTVHLTLFAQNASSSPDASLASAELLSGDHPHARGIYGIPEFHYSRLWNVDDPYLELPIGQNPLQNALKGEALAGDYGVLQSFVIKVQNPTASPQAIAIYENPRGGRATGTYLIDGVLIQSHQVPPFSRYKVRQYVVPARGFVRVTIQTIPDSGSSYPLRLVFAPDDGSVAPGAPGSPVY